MTYEEAVGYILEIPRFTKKNELNHTREFIKRLGNPQQAFLVVHVAGSNGKGSVCAFINSVLVEAGIHTGLFISPHLTDIRERFQLDKSPCSVEQFLAAEQQVRETVKKMQQEGIPHPTFFEYIFAIAMLIFQKAGVTCAVVETGLGGRLDATNIIASPLLCVITSISLEHQEILGDTIAKIAAEKAGIIKNGVPVVYDGSNEEAGFVIRKTAKARNARAFGVFPQNINILLSTGKKIDFCLDTGYDITEVQIPFGAPYQAQNAGLALAAVKELQKLLPTAAGAKARQLLDEEAVLRGFHSVVWPGRMEEIRPDVYLDGAHNPSGIRAFLDAVEKLCDRPAILLFSMVKEKDYPSALALLCERAGCWEKIILTTIPGTERAVAADSLAVICQAKVDEHVKVVSIDDVNEAFWQGITDKKPGQKMFCAGSLYLAGAIKKMAGGHAND